MSQGARSQLVRVFEVMARLRAADGCPWDRAQTHASLLPYLLEETYETIQAVEAGDSQGLAEELGDLLVELAMHTAIAAEQDGFDLEVVAARAADKMISRHPHVFGGTTVDSEEQLLRDWEALKRTEKPERTSALDGIPLALPALALASSVQRRASRAALEGGPPGPEPAELGQRLAELQGLLDGTPGRGPDLVVGELLWVLAAAARQLKVDPEGALRRVAVEWADAYRQGERRALSPQPGSERE
ncbi:MAG TPA: MazG family protein [Candidatus Nanopelagicaceae bacterium]|nr:MazG family protein [Candidatus Nanopelagicaceae bacterium]